MGYELFPGFQIAKTDRQEESSKSTFVSHTHTYAHTHSCVLVLLVLTANDLVLGTDAEFLHPFYSACCSEGGFLGTPVSPPGGFSAGNELEVLECP